ncbi:MAG: hypothetical protein JSR87_11240 [Proteobacteria bacterium]|nr:hypothetical protein [Pseudomonadota bacterium]MBS0571630.1 hypothetical protein [Pseudomonadota bacterium]
MGRDPAPASTPCGPFAARLMPLAADCARSDARKRIDPALFSVAAAGLSQGQIDGWEPAPGRTGGLARAWAALTRLLFPRP